MKNMKKALCLLLALSLTLCCALALAQDYSATEKGFGGDVTVTLTIEGKTITCLLYTSPSPRDYRTSRMPSSA